MSFQALTARLSRYPLLGYGSVTVALLVIASFTVAFFVPICTDEIVWKAIRIGCGTTDFRVRGRSRPVVPIRSTRR